MVSLLSKTGTTSIGSTGETHTNRVLVGGGGGGIVVNVVVIVVVAIF
jgi:hypothetical protein